MAGHQLAMDPGDAVGQLPGVTTTEPAFGLPATWIPDSARAEAARLGQEAKVESSRETEARVKAAADKINLKVEAAEAQIRDAVAAARAEVEAVAAEATRDMVARLAGIQVNPAEAAEAVKAQLNV